MQKYNLSVPKRYKDNQGNDKTTWVNIGKVIIMDDGKAFGELNATPTFSWNGEFQLFPIENQQQGYAPGQNGPAYHNNGQPNQNYDPNPKQGVQSNYQRQQNYNQQAPQGQQSFDPNTDRVPF